MHRRQKLHTVGCLESFDQRRDSLEPLPRIRRWIECGVGGLDGARQQFDVTVGFGTITVPAREMSFDRLQDFVQFSAYGP